MALNITDLVGFILPPLIDLINKYITDTRASFLIAASICLVIGALLNIDRIHSWQDILANAGLIFASATATYHLWWKDSSARTTLNLK